MVARVALDPAVPPGKFAVAGDRVSFRQAGEIVGRITGKALRPVSNGSEADLRAMMAGADPQKKTMLGYLLYMTNGQAALTDLKTAQYPDLKFERFADFAAAALAPAAA